MEMKIRLKKNMKIKIRMKIKIKMKMKMGNWIGSHVKLNLFQCEIGFVPM